MRFYLIFTILLTFLLCGCGGGGGGAGGLVISPASAYLSPGETVTFSVRADGLLTSIDGLRLQWSSEGGSFSFNNGLFVQFTAGDEPGDYNVTASDGQHTGYATVSVR